MGEKVTATVPRRSASEVSKIRCNEPRKYATGNSNRNPVVGAYSTVNQRGKPVHLTRDNNNILINVYSAPEKWDSVTQLSDIDSMRGWNRKRGRDPRPTQARPTQV